MKLYVARSSSFDYQTELYAPLKRSLAQNHEILFPHDAQNVSIKSRDIIAQSDVVLAEVSYPPTGQGIELGWADANDVPIICFYKAGARISSSLQFVSELMIEYVSPEDMIEQLESYLASR